MRRERTGLALGAALISVAVALRGALTAPDPIRTVDLVQIFAGGLGAGAAVAAAVATGRRRRPNIFPVQKYRDGPAALAWLERVFGFRETTRIEGPPGTIMHAELRLGPGVLMVGSLGDEADPNPWVTSPSALYVYVKDIDAHFERARAAGAEIVRELHDTSYGAREYSTRDLEGRLWSFGTYYPESHSPRPIPTSGKVS